MRLYYESDTDFSKVLPDSAWTVWLPAALGNLAQEQASVWRLFVDPLHIFLAGKMQNSSRPREERIRIDSSSCDRICASEQNWHKASRDNRADKGFGSFDALFLERLDPLASEHLLYGENSSSRRQPGLWR